MHPIKGTITDPAMDALVAPEEPNVNNMTREDLEVDFLRQQRRIGLLERKLELLDDIASGRYDLIQTLKLDIEKLGLELRNARDRAVYWQNRCEELGRSLD